MSGSDDSPPPMTCPFCGSTEIELVSPWGGQLITSQQRCRTCNTHFEAIRDDFDPARDWSLAEKRNEGLHYSARLGGTAGGRV